MASDKIVELTDANFETEVLKSSHPVLVDFWAPWCGPCRMVAPVVDELANDYDGKVKVAKLNVDDAPGTSQQYGVSSIPSFLLFKNGEVIQRAMGALPRPKLEAMIESGLD